MSNLRDRLIKASTSEYVDSLDQSTIYNNKDIVSTPIPALNIAYSADPFGGITPGLTVWAGPSKHFKTLFCLITAAAYLKKYPEAICVFYDSEFGSPADYFTAAGIDPARVIHIPVVTLEDLRHDISNVLKEVKRGDKVVIVVDSVGNLASAKEVKDAEDGSEKADMTRAKVMKSLFRIVTPHLRLKDIPLLVVNHTYDTIEMFSKAVVSGGTGVYYSADNIYIVGRQQEKDGTGAGAKLLGYNFVINVEKSRYTKEKMKIPITVLRSGGVQKWSGLFDIAVEGGFISKVNNRNYSICNPETGEVQEKTFSRSSVENDGLFWKLMFEETTLTKYIHESFSASHGTLISEEVNTDAEVQEDE